MYPSRALISRAAVFTPSAKSPFEEPLREALGRATIRAHSKEVILACLAYLVIGGTFYIIFVFSLTYGTEQLGLERSTMLILTVFSSSFGFLGLMFFGHLSDRVVRKPVCLSKPVYIGVILLVIASAFPIFWLINTEVSLLMLIGYLLATVGFCATYGPMGTRFSEAFNVRALHGNISGTHAWDDFGRGVRADYLHAASGVLRELRRSPCT